MKRLIAVILSLVMVFALLPLDTANARGRGGRRGGLAGAGNRQAGNRRSRKDAKKQLERRRHDESDSLLRDARGK